MPKRDFYQVLGVSRSASEKEIRQAYRRLARNHHPDLNPNDRAAETRFKEISEAYEVLSDADKRRQYDRFGQVGSRNGSAQPGGAPGPGGFHWSSHTGGMPGMDDIFDQLLQQVSRRQPGNRRSSGGSGDLEQTVELSLAEAILGTTRRVQCTISNGGSKTLEVRIQPGVTDGTRIRMAGQGHPASGGRPAGDIFLVVRLLNDPRFERQQDDLYTAVQIPLYQAMLGGEVEVPTPTGGRLALTLPPETQNGRRFRLAGQGMSRARGAGRGDLYADMHVTIPTGLSERERDLIRKLARLRG